MPVLWNILFLCQVDEITAEIRKPWEENLLICGRFAEEQVVFSGNFCFSLLDSDSVSFIYLMISFIWIWKSWYGPETSEVRRYFVGEAESKGVEGKGLLCAWVATHSPYLFWGWFWGRLVCFTGGCNQLLVLCGFSLWKFEFLHVSPLAIVPYRGEWTKTV